jgi:choline dehydrogenase-like flavoprotein
MISEKFGPYINKKSVQRFSYNCLFACFSTAAMYLRPAKEQAGDRLTVLANTLTHRVMFSGRRAIGIECKTGAKEASIPAVRAFAKKEVCFSPVACNRSK